MATVQRRLSVIVCADVIGHSRLMGGDELGTPPAPEAHRDGFAALFAEEGGRLAKTAGDGLLLEFPSVLQAVRASLSTQRLIAERNAAVPADKRTVFRLGIHLGDVIVDDDGVSGEIVEVAARLRDCAEPAGICVSQAVRTALHEDVDAIFRDGGGLALSDTAQPIRIYHVAPEARESPPPGPAVPASAAPRSFIIVPFTNATGEARHGYFIESLTDQLTSELLRVENSYGVPHAVATAYRGDPLDVTEIGRKLKVRFATIGRVIAGKNFLNIDIKLLEAADARQLWSDQFDLSLDDPCAMQNAVVMRVVPALRAQLRGAEEHHPPPATEAPTTPGALVVAESTPDHGLAADQVAPPIIVEPTRDAAVALEDPISTPPIAFRPAPGRSPPTLAAKPSPTWHMSFWLSWAIKLAIILAAGIVALAVFGAQRSSIVEIVSCMLVTAGIVQLIAVIASVRRRT